LTHISFKIVSINFDQFEQMIVHIFPTVQVLHLTVKDYNEDSVYMDANKWKQLILSHIPNLRVFDIQLDFTLSNNADQLKIETKINQFTTPFWIERQWFFAHHFYQSRNENRLIFCSTDPYRY